MNTLPLNQILCGDCTELLQGLPDNSIDLVVTDPPYGLSFMGKEWDRALPSREAFKQVIRVLKPGALAFVMSSPRQDLMWRMLQLLESVGFEMRQSFISWIYKTGFPKAYDVSKGMDSKLGLKRKVVGRSPHFSSGRKRTWGDGIKYGTQEGTDEETDWVTEPASDEAKLWDGWKSQTGLKPSLEPILMVNKPFSESTIVDNVLRWGTGAINVDATRIPFKNDADKDGAEVGYTYFGARNALELSKHEDYPLTPRDNSKGRFPANLLVSDGALDTGEISKSRPDYRDEESNTGESGIYGQGWMRKPNLLNDSGDQSRYFDLDAWAQHHGFLDVPKPDTRERDYGLKGVKREPKSKFNKSDGKNERFDGATSIPRRNTHPTVKPIKLMAYLIELGCPRNGIVLDPFVGSGTTCIAAKQLGRRYIGIEIKQEYHALAEARVAAYPQPLEWFQESQDVH